MLALFLFEVVEEDVDESVAAAVEDMEVLTTLDAAAVAAEAAATAALRALLLVLVSGVGVGLALILFAAVEEDVDESAAAAMEDMEVLTTLDPAAEVAEASAAAALRAAWIFFCL